MVREADVLAVDCLVGSAAGDAGHPPSAGVPVTLRLYLPVELGTSVDVEATLRGWVDGNRAVDIVIRRQSGIGLVEMKQGESSVTLPLEHMPLPH
jgi:hypothetical protein